MKQATKGPPDLPAIHAHHEEHHHAPAMQGQPAYAQEQEELLELGDHFQCLGCGCHIQPAGGYDLVVLADESPQNRSAPAQ